MGKGPELIWFDAAVELDYGLERTIDWYREHCRWIVTDVVTDRIASPRLTSVSRDRRHFADVVATGCLTMAPKVTEFEQGLAAACGPPI